MKDPRIEYLFKDVKWQTNPEQESSKDGLPYATHSGVLRIFDCDLRCHRLSNGDAVFDADDFKAMLDKIGMPNFYEPPHNS